MELFGTAGIRGDARSRVTPSLALAVGRAVGADAVAAADPSVVADADATAGADATVGADATGAADATVGADATGAAAAEVDAGSVDPVVVVGRDGRTTGSALAAAVVAGATSAGARVLRAGQLPTPSLAYATRGRYGVQVTASHNPPQDNGLKCFADGEEYHRDAERRVEERVEAGVGPARWDEWGESEPADVLEAYRSAVVDYARTFGPVPSSLTVVVDCGNGVGSVATPQVLRALGATVVALNANVDGHFPGRPSKPTPETLTDLCEFVADRDGPVIGIGHDGDADRVVLVDGEGTVVHEDTVVAILAEQYVRQSDVDAPVVVTTPNASGRIDDRVEAAGGRVERVRLGALHEGIRRVTTAAEPDGAGTVVFAAEPWKHIHVGLGPWIDGVTSAAVLTTLVAGADVGTDDPQAEPKTGLAALREPITERPYRKVSVDCPDDSKAVAMERLRASLPDRFPEATVETEYGVRLAFDDGSWVLVRPSGTEPYVRLYAEADDVDDLVATVRDQVVGAVAASS